MILMSHAWHRSTIFSTLCRTSHCVVCCAAHCRRRLAVANFSLCSLYLLLAYSGHAVVQFERYWCRVNALFMIIVLLSFVLLSLCCHLLRFAFGSHTHTHTHTHIEHLRVYDFIRCVRDVFIIIEFAFLICVDYLYHVFRTSRRAGVL